MPAIQVALAAMVLCALGRANAGEVEPPAAGVPAPGPGAAPASAPAVAPAPSSAPAAAPATEAPPPPSGEQALAAGLGMRLGGRSTPGGLELRGTYLYRLSEDDWFDGGLGFSFGGGGAACFRDRKDHFVCDHGVVDGFSGELWAGVRRYFPGQGRFAPFARVALGLRLDSYGGDDVKGLAIPVELGGGVRAQVADRVSVLGTAGLGIGVAFFDHDLGTEPQLSLSVLAGVEFALP